MLIRLDAQRAQIALTTILLLLVASFVPVASGLEPLNEPIGEASLARDRCVPGLEAEAAELAWADALPTLGGSPVRLILIQGVVEPIERDFLGRPERVALVFVTSQGFLVQNAVEDVAAGEKLKDHVGENVTVRGALLVKADGRPTLLIDAFEVHGSADGDRGD